MTPATKKYRLFSRLFFIISILFNVAPLAAYTIMGLGGGALVHEKVALCATVFIVLILTLIAFVNKMAMRSKVWILLLGLYFALDNFVVPLLLIAVTQILDEWIITPLYKRYNRKYSINREIDKRM